VMISLIPKNTFQRIFYFARLTIRCVLNRQSCMRDDGGLWKPTHGLIASTERPIMPLKFNGWKANRSFKP
jgi:hypothetical protein